MFSLISVFRIHYRGVSQFAFRDFGNSKNNQATTKLQEGIRAACSIGNIKNILRICKWMGSIVEWNTKWRTRTKGRAAEWKPKRQRVHRWCGGKPVGCRALAGYSRQRNTIFGCSFPPPRFPLLRNAYTVFREWRWLSYRSGSRSGTRHGKLDITR